MSHLLSGPLNSELYGGATLCCFNWVYWSEDNVQLKAKTAYCLSSTPCQKQKEIHHYFQVKLYCSEVAFSYPRRLTVVLHCVSSLNLVLYVCCKMEMNGKK